MMLKMFKWGVVLCLYQVVPGILFAQSSHSTSLSIPSLIQKPVMFLTYNQSNNIYYWRGFASIDKMIGKGFLSVRNNLDINRIKLISLDDKWKDNNQFNAQYFLPVTETFSAILSARSNYLSDLQSGFLNNIYENSLLLQTPGNIFQAVMVTPMVGYKWDKRVGKTDNGLQYGINVDIIENSVGDYNAEGQVRFMRENLDLRRNNNYDFNVSLNRTFYKNTADTLRLTRSNQRRDYYISLSGNLETRKENLKGFSNILRYDAFDQANIRILTEYSSGEVDISSTDADNTLIKRTRKDNRFLIDIALETRLGSHNGRIFLTLENKEQRYTSSVSGGKVFGSLPFDNPDNDSKRISLGLTAGGTVFQSHSYSIQGVLDKFQYDTPSENNNDDLDDFRFWFQGKYSIKINSRLSVSLISLASIDHQVYIFSQRSADNNWNRIFKAGGLVEYKSPSGFQIKSDFNVLANYIDYDFDDTFVQIRSFVFRRFKMNQFVSLPVTRKGRIETRLELNLEENGLLRWDDFVQNILSDRTILSGSLNYYYRVTPALEVTPGFSFYSRNETHHQVRVLHAIQSRLTKIDDKALTLNIKYRTSPSTLVSLSSTKRFVKRGGAKEKFQYVDLSLNWLF